MSAFYPTPEQIANWHFFSQMLLGLVAVFFGIAWVLDRGIDLVVALWNRRRSNVISFEERRAELRRVMGGR